MLKSLVLALGMVALLLATPATAMAAGTRFEAALSGAGTSMKGRARYEEVPRRTLVQQRLSVEVQNARPFATFTVSAKGVKIATLTTNALGRAELQLRTNSDDPKNVAFLPKLKAGDVVTVGPVSGALARR
jgi:hypothetical protein